MIPHRLVAAAAAAWFLTGPALAQQPAGQQPAGEQALLQQACTGDYLALCGTIDPASKEVEACFESKMAQLTPVCRQAITGYKQRNPKGGRPTN